MSNVLGMDGKPKQPTGPIYNMRLCLIGQADIDIKNIQTFGIAEDGFFMVKSYNKDHATDISFENEQQQTLKNNHNQDI